MYTVRFETLGCRLNQIETEAAAGAFAEAGFRICMDNTAGSEDIPSETILCVVNTCTVTSKAEQKARRIIRLLLSRYPSAAVAVTGCYAEVDADSIAALDSRIAVLPGRIKDALLDVPCILFDSLTRFEQMGAVSGERIAELLRTVFSTERKPDPFRFSAETFFKHSRAAIKIQDGCANRCSYCRIRLARGTPVSLDVCDVISRVRQLEAAGYPEAVLTGVNLSQYRSSWQGKPVDAADMLSLLLSHTEKIRLRISSLYPERVDDAFCRAADNRRVSPFFHLSVQSGSDSILSAMRRPYTSAQVVQAVERIRSLRDDAFIACDIIVGFPGETEEDFARTVELCRTCRFAWIHVFPFSPRPGTEAYTMKPKIPQSVSGERVKILTEIAVTQKREYIRQCAGKTYWAVAERSRGERMHRSTAAHAVTENFLHVQLVNPPQQPIEAGSAVQVTIIGPVPENCDVTGDSYDTLARIITPESSV